MKNGEFKIEKGIKLPTVTRGSRQKYPFADMKVGDSIAVPQMAGGSLRSTVSAASRRLKMKFTVALQEDKSYRIWRIK